MLACFAASGACANGCSGSLLEGPALVRTHRTTGPPDPLQTPWRSLRSVLRFEEEPSSTPARGRSERKRQRQDNLNWRSTAMGPLEVLLRRRDGGGQASSGARLDSSARGAGAEGRERSEGPSEEERLGCARADGRERGGGETPGETTSLAPGWAGRAAASSSCAHCPLLRALDCALHAREQTSAFYRALRPPPPRPLSFAGTAPAAQTRDLPLCPRRSQRVHHASRQLSRTSSTASTLATVGSAKCPCTRTHAARASPRPDPSSPSYPTRTRRPLADPSPARHERPQSAHIPS